MKNFYLVLGIAIILVAVSYIAFQNYGYVETITLSWGNSSNSVAIPIGGLFLGLLFVLAGISPSKKVGSYPIK